MTPFQFSQGSDWKRFDWVGSRQCDRCLWVASKPTQQYEFVRLLAKPTQEVASVSGELAVDGLPAIKIEHAAIALERGADGGTFYKSISNKYGSYIVGNLLPGKYRLRVAAAGFEDYRSEAFELAETQNLKFDVVLKAREFGALKVNVSEHVSNRILPDARLVLVNSSKSTISNALGKAVFNNVVPGNYLLKIEKNAFQTAQIEVRVEAKKTTEINIAVIKDELFGHENLLANAGFEKAAIGCVSSRWNDPEGKSDPAFSAVEGNTFFSGSKSARMHPAGMNETILEQ